MLDLWTDPLDCLELRSCDDGEQPREAEVVVLKGRNQLLEYHRLFGGQLLGQFVRAACLGCPDKTVKSLHAVFAREGRADEPVRYQVTLGDALDHRPERDHRRPSAIRIVDAHTAGRC